MSQNGRPFWLILLIYKWHFCALPLEANRQKEGYLESKQTKQKQKKEQIWALAHEVPGAALHEAVVVVEDVPGAVVEHPGAAPECRERLAHGTLKPKKETRVWVKIEPSAGDPRFLLLAQCTRASHFGYLLFTHSHLGTKPPERTG